MNNNQFNPNEQNQQNNQYNPNQQYQQNNQYNPNQQYQQNQQYNPNQQYQQYNQYNPNQQYQQPYEKDFFDKVTSFILDTPVEKEPISPQDIQENKFISLVGYLGIFCFIPLLVSRNSRFARFHANQGLVLLLVTLALLIVTPIAGVILAFVPILGGIVSGILPFVVGAAELGYMILGIYNCVKGRANEIPFIGKFRIIKTVPEVNVNYNNVNNNNYNAPNNYNNMPNMNNMPDNMNTGYNTAPVKSVDITKKDSGFDVEAYSTGKENAGFTSNAYSNGVQEAVANTAENSEAKPSLNLNKNNEQ
ncbi:MAG: hypothetical protein U0L18_00225 [Acutalibacteraceae bacterium]|nr:hypothetical protein [Acutalibacteraceae bacterium]